MDVFSEIMKPVVQVLVAPLKKQLGYLISCPTYVRNMHTKMRELDVARQGEEDHLNRNTRSSLEISSQVGGWLKEVEKINAEVENFPGEVGTCFNLKNRHKLGRKAFKIIEAINSVIRQQSLITWTDDPIPLGRVDSMKRSTSTLSTTNLHNDFQSRENIFTKAMKALELNHESHMIALCGMGGVGKTTMMRRLKKVVKEKKMFKFIVEAVVGEKTDPIALQEDVATYLGLELKEKNKQTRADKLRERFKANSDGGKNKFLIILDDVWQSVDLEDIGLSPLPNQGVDFRILLTSRDRHICAMMGVEANLILSVGLLLEAEAQSLFRQFIQISDLELQKIGEDIVRKCCGLPIAIKTIACTLRNKSKDAWKDAISRLDHHDINNVAPKVFETSYDNLQDEETKSIFLLCGLFPEDFDIPTEELMRYGWGLKIFNRVSNIREARNRVNTCIERLLHTNLLLESDDFGCVKMHDLVRDFVLDMFSKVEHASIVNHGWPENENVMSISCKRISLSCQGMSKFPRDLKFPELLILKLINGDKSTKFPQDFYGEMEKLQVISYDRMKYPLLPSSLDKCSTNLRVLHLHRCSLKFDCSSIGNLLNLEVLSMVNSGIRWLPSTVGNLKKLRILDLTQCVGLRIDDGVLKNLVKLEELYVRVYERHLIYMRGYGRKALNFTEANCNEMAECSKKLSTLVFEFFENNAQPKNMSFENLDRFQISMGCSLDVDFSKSRPSFENTLELVTNKSELLQSRMNELFEKTHILCLSVNDMNDLEDVERKLSHPPQSSSFYNLRVLVVSKCPELRYLFTLRVATNLPNIEHLEVDSCPILEAIIRSDNNNEDEKIRFPKLKFLSLRRLPKLSGLCHNVNIVELPQLTKLELVNIPNFTSIYPMKNMTTSCFLKEEVVIPKLEKLHINDMENLKEIWPCEEINVSLLKEIKVSDCDNLVNLFPCNPMPLIHHLEELEVVRCGSIEVLFNIDLGCVGEFGEVSRSCLRSIKVKELGKLRDVWSIKSENNCDHIDGFVAVESIKIEMCKRFENVFTPTTTNFDLGALREIYIDCRERVEYNELEASSQEQEIDILSKKETSQVSDNVVFPSHNIHLFHNLHNLTLWKYEEAEAVFEMESPSSRNLVTIQDDQQSLLLPYLEELTLFDMNRMSRVWKCNWNKIVILQKRPSESPFHNLTTICMEHCKNVKYLFSPLMAKLLSNLKKIAIRQCDSMQELVSNIDDEVENTASTSTHTSNITLFPHLHSLRLKYLQNLKRIGGGAADGGTNKISFSHASTTTIFNDQIELSGMRDVSWSLCQYPRKIEIDECPALSTAIPSYALGQMQKLQVLEIDSCNSMSEVFETQSIKNNGGFHSTNYVDDRYGTGTTTTTEIPRPNNVIMLKLSNLKTMKIYRCPKLEHIFTFSALESLKQLEDLIVEDCKTMKVIVKEEHEEERTMASSKVVVFPCLKSIVLEDLPELVGFFLRMNEFRWPLLDKVTIINCPKMIVFAPAGSTAPQLKYMHTSLGKHTLQCGLNFHVTTTAHQTPLLSLDCTSLCPTTLQELPWSFHNLIKLKLRYGSSVEKIFPSNMLLQLQKLEKIIVHNCEWVEEVFEAFVGTNSTSFEDESLTTVVELPNLTDVKIVYPYRLKHIWKNNQWTAFQFPNLTRLYIHGCGSLETVFTSSMVCSLLQLQQLDLGDCKNMEVIVTDTNDVVEEEEEASDHGKINEILLPRLKSLKIDHLPCLKGFCLGMENFALPLLDTLSIKRCPSIMMFNKGSLATPELKAIKTSFGSYDVAGDINSFIKTKQEEFKEATINVKYI